MGKGGFAYHLEGVAPSTGCGGESTALCLGAAGGDAGGRADGRPEERGELARHCAGGEQSVNRAGKAERRRRGKGVEGWVEI